MLMLEEKQLELIRKRTAAMRDEISLSLDPGTAEMSVDLSFGRGGPDRPGVTLDRSDWPHGETGPGDPHGAVFSRPLARGDS